MIIKFRNEYDFLSNFYSVPIMFRGTLYQSVEAAYMSARNDSVEWKTFCADPMSSAGEIKRRSKLIEDRADWFEIKLQIMEECLRLKFQHPHLKEKLLATGDQNIQEGNEWKDDFWGVRLDVQPNYGENHLGRLLMKIRSELKSKPLSLMKLKERYKSELDDLYYKMLLLKEDVQKVFIGVTVDDQGICIRLRNSAPRKDIESFLSFVETFNNSIFRTEISEPAQLL